MIRLHREGNIHITVATIAGAVLSVAAYLLLWPISPWLALLLWLPVLLIWVWVVSFFRNPLRTVTPDDGIVLCPADGKVVVIEEVDDAEYFGDRRLQVSVFMSPFNVHYNKAPVTGKVLWRKYYPGKFLVAWHPKSSELNERLSVVIEHPQVTLLVRQVAGALARRIVNYLQPGDFIHQGDELGFIKFGSRVDILLPVGTPLNVALGDTVQANKTILATLSKSKS